MKRESEANDNGALNGVRAILPTLSPPYVLALHVAC